MNNRSRDPYIRSRSSAKASGPVRIVLAGTLLCGQQLRVPFNAHVQNWTPQCREKMEKSPPTLYQV